MMSSDLNLTTSPSPVDVMSGIACRINRWIFWIKQKEENGNHQIHNIWNGWLWWWWHLFGNENMLCENKKSIFGNLIRYDRTNAAYHFDLPRYRRIFGLVCRLLFGRRTTPHNHTYENRELELWWGTRLNLLLSACVVIVFVNYRYGRVVKLLYQIIKDCNNSNLEPVVFDSIKICNRKTGLEVIITVYYSFMIHWYINHWYNSLILIHWYYIHWYITPLIYWYILFLFSRVEPSSDQSWSILLLLALID